MLLYQGSTLSHHSQVSTRTSGCTISSSFYFWKCCGKYGLTVQALPSGGPRPFTSCLMQGTAAVSTNVPRSLALGTFLLCLSHARHSWRTRWQASFSFRGESAAGSPQPLCPEPTCGEPQALRYSLAPLSKAGEKAFNFSLGDLSKYFPALSFCDF